MTNSKKPWLQCGSLTVFQEDVPALLVNLSLMPLFLRRLIEYQSSKPFLPTTEEQMVYQQAFMLRERITDESTLADWLSRAGLSEGQMSKMLYQSLRLEQFKRHKFTALAENIFLEKKHDYDRVTYSLIRVPNRSQAVELHLRLEDEEATFGELASQFSQGFERESNGQIGPIELGIINPTLSERLRVSKDGQLWPPFEVDNWWLILRLEKHLPAQYDSAMQAKIIDKLYEAWMLDQVKTGLDSLFAQPLSDSTDSANSESIMDISSGDVPPTSGQDDEGSGNIMNTLLSRLRGKR
jgi:hypothetical protein